MTVRVRSESAQRNRPWASVLGAGCDVCPLGGLDGAGTFPGVGSDPELRTGGPLTGAVAAEDVTAREVAAGDVGAGAVAAAGDAVVASADFAGVGLAGEVAAVCPAGDVPAGVVLEVAAAVGLTGDVAAGFAGEVGFAGDAAADDVPPESAGVESTAGPFAPSCVAIDPGEMVLDASTPVSVGIADASAAAVLPLDLTGFPLDRLAMMNITPIRAATAATMTMTRRSQ